MKGPKAISTDRDISPEEAYIGEILSIDHMKVQGSKCYFYLNPKTLPAKGRYNKLVDRGRESIFVGYTGTISQLRVYTLDLGYTIRSSIVNVDEDIPGGTIDLRLRNNPSSL